MEQKPTITSMQWAMMYIGSALAFPYTFLPIINTPPQNQDIWVVLLVSLVFTLVMNLPLLFIMNKFRGFNANEIADMILGKFFGKVLNLAFVCLCLYCFIACTMASIIFMKFYLFTYTPIWFMLCYAIIPISYLAYKGAGTIGRLAAILVPFIIVTIIFYLIFGLKELDLNVFKPVLADSTFLQIMQGAFFTSARISEILILFIFSYFLEEKAKINKTYAISLIVFGACYLLILIPTVMSLGVDLAKSAWSPYFLYTRQVKVYDFIERLQALNTLAWFPVIITKIAIYSFMGCYVFSGIVNAKSHKPFVIPFSILAFIICLLPIMNKSSTIDFLRSDQVFPFIVFPVTTILPVIVLIVFLIRRKKINQLLKQKQSSGLPSN